MFLSVCKPVSLDDPWCKHACYERSLPPFYLFVSQLPLIILGVSMLVRSLPPFYLLVSQLSLWLLGAVVATVLSFYKSAPLDDPWCKHAC